MTDSNRQKEISKVLWANAQINELSFNKEIFNPSNHGHGIYVKTEGQDTIYDLRMSNERPFWGHTHPILTQHSFKTLNNPLELHYYSVPNNEFVSIIETFQKVHFEDVLSDSFKITYHNVVINVDEKLLSHDQNLVKQKLKDLIDNNPETFFWIVEQDIILLCEDDIFYFKDLMREKHVHLCLKFHFLSSTFIYSHHLFSEDDNIQLFLSIKNMFNNIISTKVSGKNSIDFKTIDEFISKNPELSLRRVGRYIQSNKDFDTNRLNKNGVINTKTINSPSSFSFPLSCTTKEVIDVLERIKKSI